MNDDSISSSGYTLSGVDDSVAPHRRCHCLSLLLSRTKKWAILCADDEHNNIRRKVVVVVVVSSSSFLYFVLLFCCFCRRLFILFSGISSPFYSFSFRSVSFRFFYLDISPLVYYLFRKCREKENDGTSILYDSRTRRRNEPSSKPVANEATKV
jgi:hypothetical protein